MRRNLGLVATIATIFVLLVAGIAGVSWFALEANSASRESKRKTVQVTREKRAAQNAQAIAEQNEKVARSQSQLALLTLESIIIELQRGLEDLPGAGKIRRRILNVSLEKLDEVAREFVAQSSVNLDTAIAVSELGDLVMRFGIDEEAEDSVLTNERKTAVEIARLFYEKGLEIFKALAESESDRKTVYNLAVSYVKVGDLDIEIGAIDTGVQRFKKSLEVLEKQPADDFEIQQAMHMAHDRLGNAQRLLGNFQEAEKHYRKALAFAHSVADSDPENMTFRDNLSVAQDEVGKVLLKTNRIAEAESHFQDSFQIRQQIVESHPDSRRGQHLLSTSHLNFGEVFLKTENWSDASKQFEISLGILNDLADADTSDPNDSARFVGHPYEDRYAVHRGGDRGGCGNPLSPRPKNPPNACEFRSKQPSLPTRAGVGPPRNRRPLFRGWKIGRRGSPPAIKL